MQKKKEQEVPNVQTKVSTVSEWIGKSDRTFNLTVPSGITILAKRLNLIDLAITGYIPFDLISNSMKTAQTMRAGENWETISKEDLSNISGMFDKAVILAVIEPKVTEEGENGSMPVGKIPFADKFFIFSNVVDMGGTEVLKPFRGK